MRGENPSAIAIRNPTVTADVNPRSAPRTVTSAADQRTARSSQAAAKIS